MQIGQITLAHLDQEVEIAGVVTGIWDLSKGRKYHVYDQTGILPVIIWDNLLEQHPEIPRMLTGAVARFRGRVKEYKGELRLMPAQPEDIRLVQPADPSTRSPVPLSRLPEVGTGNMAWVVGRITSMKAFSKGIKLHIADDSGAGVVLIWSSLLQASALQDQLEINLRLGVYGEVRQFHDEWEIVPLTSVELIPLEAPPAS
ncbi:MAG: hypothetical protein ACUVWB_13775 [Anaerolineae bacterium]